MRNTQYEKYEASSFKTTLAEMSRGSAVVVHRTKYSVE